MELNKKSEKIQVATLLTVIGEEAREVYATFTGWENEDDNNKIEPVLQKFADYCHPRKSVPFERYCFNRRVQESGESYEQYRTALRKLSVGCDFQSITPEEILRDRLVFGIRDNKVRERLLREPRLTLDKTDEICRAAESLDTQMKTIMEGSSTLVNAVKSQDSPKDKLHKGNTLCHKVSQTCRSVGTVGANITHARGSYVQHLASYATNVINQIILQTSAATRQVEAQ